MQAKDDISDKEGVFTIPENREEAPDHDTGFLFCPRCGHVVMTVNPNSFCPACGYRFCASCFE